MNRPTRNAEYTREYNRKLFLRLLRGEPLSRAEVARKMGLTRAATSLIADELLSEGLIRETAATQKRMGRTPVPLTLVPESGYAVGVYLNRDGCTAGIVDICGGVHCSERIRFDHLETDKVVTVADSIQTMMRQLELPQEKVVGVGISAPGPLDGESGRILNPPRFNLWHNTDVGSVMQQRLQMPVYLENNASCLARFNYGRPEAQGSENFLLLLVDSGIGSGIISHGKILKGAGFFTSELGHSSINFRGRRCVCGSFGCLEMYASIPNLLRDSSFGSWQQVLEQQLNSPEAQSLIEREAEYLATGIINVANMVGIDTVLLAGDLYHGADFFAPILEEKVNSRMLRRDVLPLRVLPSRSSSEAPIQAAADVAFGRFLMV